MCSFPFILELSLPQMCLSLVILHVKDGAESVLHVLFQWPKQAAESSKQLWFYGCLWLLWILSINNWITSSLFPGHYLTTESPHWHTTVWRILPCPHIMTTQTLSEEPHLPWSSLTPYAWSASWPLQRSVKWIPGNTMNCHDYRTASTLVAYDSSTGTPPPSIPRYIMNYPTVLGERDFWELMYVLCMSWLYVTLSGNTSKQLNQN